MTEEERERLIGEILDAIAKARGEEASEEEIALFSDMEDAALRAAHKDWATGGQDAQDLARAYLNTQLSSGAIDEDAWRLVDTWLANAQNARLIGSLQGDALNQAVDAQVLRAGETLRKAAEEGFVAGRERAATAAQASRAAAEKAARSVFQVAYYATIVQPLLDIVEGRSPGDRTLATEMLKAMSGEDFVEQATERYLDFMSGRDDVVALLGVTDVDPTWLTTGPYSYLFADMRALLADAFPDIEPAQWDQAGITDIKTALDRVVAPFLMREAAVKSRVDELTALLVKMQTGFDVDAESIASTKDKRDLNAILSGLGKAERLNLSRGYAEHVRAGGVLTPAQFLSQELTPKIALALSKNPALAAVVPNDIIATLAGLDAFESVADKARRQQVEGAGAAFDTALAQFAAAIPKESLVEFNRQKAQLRERFLAGDLTADPTAFLDQAFPGLRQQVEGAAKRKAEDARVGTELEPLLQDYESVLAARIAKGKEIGLSDTDITRAQERLDYIKRFRPDIVGKFATLRRANPAYTPQEFINQFVAFGVPTGPAPFGVDVLDPTRPDLKVPKQFEEMLLGTKERPSRVEVGFRTVQTTSSTAPPGTARMPIPGDEPQGQATLGEALQFGLGEGTGDFLSEVQGLLTETAGTGLTKPVTIGQLQDVLGRYAPGVGRQDFSQGVNPFTTFVDPQTGETTQVKFDPTKPLSPEQLKVFLQVSAEQAGAIRSTDIQMAQTASGATGAAWAQQAEQRAREQREQAVVRRPRPRPV